MKKIQPPLMDSKPNNKVTCIRCCFSCGFPFWNRFHFNNRLFKTMETVKQILSLVLSSHFNRFVPALELQRHTRRHTVKNSTMKHEFYIILTNKIYISKSIINNKNHTKFSFTRQTFTNIIFFYQSIDRNTFALEYLCICSDERITR